jgi:hypothetical protein
MLFWGLLLGRLYRISGLQLAHQVMCDLVFRRICRIESDQSVPDAVTLGRFRGGVGWRMDARPALVNRTRAARNLIGAKEQIAIVDPTMIEAAQPDFKARDPEGGSRSNAHLRAGWLSGDEKGL